MMKFTKFNLRVGEKLCIGNDKHWVETNITAIGRKYFTVGTRRFTVNSYEGGRCVDGGETYVYASNSSRIDLLKRAGAWLKLKRFAFVNPEYGEPPTQEAFTRLIGEISDALAKEF